MLNVNIYCQLKVQDGTGKLPKVLMPNKMVSGEKHRKVLLIKTNMWPVKVTSSEGGREICRVVCRLKRKMVDVRQLIIFETLKLAFIVKRIKIVVDRVSLEKLLK